jgi:hypothetical protein
VRRELVYVAVFALIQIAMFVQFYRVFWAALRLDHRVWYKFAVLALLVVAEGVVLFGLYRLTW